MVWYQVAKVDRFGTQIIPRVDEFTHTFCPSDLHISSLQFPLAFHDTSAVEVQPEARRCEDLDPSSIWMSFCSSFPCNALNLLSFSLQSRSTSISWTLEQILWGSLDVFSYFKRGALPSFPWCSFPWRSSLLMPQLQPSAQCLSI